MLVGGLDEVGWGAICGPIISVVACFRREDLALLPAGVKDSKQVTKKAKDSLYLPLCAAAHDVGIGHAWPWEIDTLGPYNALQLSYTRALGELRRPPDLLIVDGSNRIRSFKGEQRVEKKADVNHIQVSAASIIAKVFRDRAMVKLSRLHPHYRWEENKGYESQAHGEAIRRHGLLISSEHHPDRYVHRKAFCSKYL